MTTAAPAPTTTVKPRNPATGLPDADHMDERGICRKTADHGIPIQYPCPP